MKSLARIAMAQQLAAERADGRIVRGRDLPPMARTLLIREGVLREILKGWYFFVDPNSPTDLLTLWREEFWRFLHLHLSARGGYCLGPENSLDLHIGRDELPEHVTALLAKGGNNTVHLRGTGVGADCTLLTWRTPLPVTRVTEAGMNVMSAGYALARVSPRYYPARRDGIQRLLRDIPATELARGMLEANIEAGAERILGALEAAGLEEKARDVRALVAEPGWTRAVNPFPAEPPSLVVPSNPLRNIRDFWRTMRPIVLENFPRPPASCSLGTWIDRARQLFAMDTYHALTMEGNELSPTHVEEIAGSERPRDIEENVRLAIKGYIGAHAAVLKSIRQAFIAASRGAPFLADVSGWHAESRRPFGSTISGSNAEESSGYFESAEMRALVLALEEEPFAAVRAILGHFLFLQIGPFPGNNHVMASFLLNALLSTERYPWTIVRVARTNEYRAALKKASADILPLVRFLKEEMENPWE